MYKVTELESDAQKSDFESIRTNDEANTQESKSARRTRLSKGTDSNRYVRQVTER